MSQEVKFNSKYPYLMYKSKQTIEDVYSYLGEGYINEYVSIEYDYDKFVYTDEGVIEMPFTIESSDPYDKDGYWYGHDDNSLSVNNMKLTGKLYVDEVNKTVNIYYDDVDVTYDIINNNSKYSFYRDIKDDVIYYNMEINFSETDADYKFRILEDDENI